MFFNKIFFNALLIGTILLLVFWLFAGVIEYCLIALVVSAILRTPVNYIANWQIYSVKVPRTVAIVFSFSLLFLIIGLFVALFVPLILEQIEVLLRLNFSEILATIISPIDSLEKALIRIGLVETTMQGTLKASLLKYITNWFGKLDVSTFFNDLVSYTGGLLAGTFAVLFISFFLLSETTYIRKKLISLIPNRYFEVSITAIVKIEKLLSNYLLGLFLQMIAIFTTTSIGLSVIGIHYAVTIGVFTAVANLIPYIGPLIGALFGLFVGLSTTNNIFSGEIHWWFLGKIGIVFAIVQLIDNVLLQPIIFSRSVKAHPLEIFLVVIAAANLLGAIGMIIAIPAYTVLKVSFTEFYKGYRKYRLFQKST